jgi:hypothetical protein
VLCPSHLIPTGVVIPQKCRQSSSASETFVVRGFLLRQLRLTTRSIIWLTSLGPHRISSDCVVQPNFI